MRDRQRFESLRTLAPREAVQAWLNGEFGIDDEPALIEAVRRDLATNVEKLRTAGPVIGPLVEEKKVKVVGALYDLRTGRVEFLS